MPTWTTPKTWSTGEALSASDMNTHIRDNLSALKAPPTDSYVCNEVADYTSSQTSFVDVDASNLALTITTTGGDVMIGFHAYTYNPSGVTYFDVDLDGVRIAGDDGMIATVSGYQTVSFVRLVTNLDAGTHTFKLQWKVSGGTVTLYAGAGTSTADVHPQFWVREI